MSPTRLQRRKEKESAKQALRYLFLLLLVLVLIFKFGLPALIKLAGFLGEIKTSSEPVEKTDTVAPAAPTLLPIPEATFSAKIDLSGYAEGQTTVKLYLNGLNLQETLADQSGSFSFSEVVLKDGSNEFYVISTDSQGNSSEPSKTVAIILDQTPPELTIEVPGNNQRFFDKDSPITIKGKTEPQVNLTINGRFVLVTSEGKFSLNYNLNPGDNQLEVIATDKAGNSSKKLLTVNYTP